MFWLIKASSQQWGLRTDGSIQSPPTTTDQHSACCSLESGLAENDFASYQLLHHTDVIVSLVSEQKTMLSDTYRALATDSWGQMGLTKPSIV